jgi:hypothetical protein
VNGMAFECEVNLFYAAALGRFAKCRFGPGGAAAEQDAIRGVHGEMILRDVHMEVRTCRLMYIVRLQRY